MIVKPQWTEKFAAAMKEQMYWSVQVIEINARIDANKQIIELYEGTVFADEILATQQIITALEEDILFAERKFKEVAKVIIDEIPDPS